MALRVARGLFRLWLVLSVLWISGVVATTNWRGLVYYQPVIQGEQSSTSRLQSTVEICLAAKKAEECADMLKAAGKNPFDAFDLRWTDTRWEFPTNAVMVPEGISWQRVGPRAGLALIPPVLVLVIGSALVWAFRGFR